ncbi:hypothetical protein BGZ80_000970 [Entomortierella chlamydospora]|uniref:Endonuclease/exonuclease/phosphatase domain-containing protein n=1 Tax=Entomortierella chlamydospora TaxID=101097 RepID=A0A9P6SY26_9FUNG|nr:hypothetical protein BGZ79_001095 [Entomortierella chlamydospora]KAG0011077.1 hypothetical protein BGZ80_000970 [Entomortierella chlamydospora]
MSPFNETQPPEPLPEALSSPSSSSAPLSSNNRTVPTPRPGELLIYDCRPPSSSPQALGSTASLLDRDTANPIAIAHHASSPPTPTPNTGEATFQSQSSPRSTTNSNSSINMQGSLATSPLSEDSGSRPSSSTPSAVLNSGAGSSSSSSAHTTMTTSLSHDSTDVLFDRPIRCLQWNIERNYKAQEILDTLTELNADILCIQEIDIGCRRSGYDRDHFLEICKSQGLYGGFVPEFCELEHPKRKDRDQGGGVHGNAIFSRWPINGFRVLDHVHHAYEWERDGLKLNEPRLGRRFTIVADIQTPSGPLLCYSAHLEVFTGIVGRISALSDVLADSALYADKYPYQILFGDLNTISHSIARLAKAISNDQYRVASLGSQESEWWDNNLWSWHVQDGEFNLALATGGWSWLRRLGLLGLGTGRGQQGDKDAQKSSNLWPADIKYTHWLRSLVEAGIDNIKQARQDQLLTDKFITVEHQENYSYQLTAAGSEHPVIAHGHLDSDEFESEKSYHEDGSVVLVGRPRSPSIITLESSLIDRNECMSSSSTWSSPSTTSTRRYRRHEDSDDESEFDHQRGSGLNRTSSTPSTPSPTLRLIPPTPKEDKRNSFSKSREEDRGIPLLYDGEYDDDEDGVHDIGDELRDSLLRQQFGFYDNDTLYRNDQHINDTVMTTETTSQRDFTSTTTTITSTTTTTFTTTASVTASSAITKEDIFKDPQPPFLLSSLKMMHPFFSTQRLWSGFTPLVLHQARNPGFYDPWSSCNDVTLHNPNFFGLLKAKLDYTLLMNLKCVGRHVGNHDYSASDHKWLLVEVEFEREFETKATLANAEATDVVEKEKKPRGDKFVMPSKEQQYLWWRERRQEWGQSVQPIASEVDRHRGKKSHHGHEQGSSLLAKSLLTATLTTVAVGGFWLWSRGK